MGHFSGRKSTSNPRTVKPATYTYIHGQNCKLTGHRNPVIFHTEIHHKSCSTYPNIAIFSQHLNWEMEDVSNVEKGKATQTSTEGNSSSQQNPDAIVVSDSDEEYLLSVRFQSLFKEDGGEEGEGEGDGDGNHRE